MSAEKTPERCALATPDDVGMTLRAEKDAKVRLKGAFWERTRVMALGDTLELNRPATNYTLVLSRK